jgi:cell volume regulation protein A
VLRRIALPASGLYPIAALAWAVAAYGLGVLCHLSGFAAVYVCAVILGNGELPHRHAIRSFAEGVGWISQIALFMMLGLLSSTESISSTDIVFGVLAGLFLTLVARPASVIASVWCFRGLGKLTPKTPRNRFTRLLTAAFASAQHGIPWQDQAFLSWAGLRGAVPIILATVPLADGINDSELLFDLVVVFVVVFTVIQAPTLPWAARKLGLIDPNAAYDVDIEAAPLEERRADLLQITIPAGSRLAGVSVLELRLPPNVIIALIMRGDESFSPDGHTQLRVGDDLLIITPAESRHAVEERLTAIGRHGRLAIWRKPPGE